MFFVKQLWDELSDKDATASSKISIIADILTVTGFITIVPTGLFFAIRYLDKIADKDVIEGLIALFMLLIVAAIMFGFGAIFSYWYWRVFREPGNIWEKGVLSVIAVVVIPGFFGTAIFVLHGAYLRGMDLSSLLFP